MSSEAIIPEGIKSLNNCQSSCGVVLYLYIYIALLAVHTNQKRFQGERPRENELSARSSRPLRSADHRDLLVSWSRTYLSLFG